MSSFLRSSFDEVCPVPGHGPLNGQTKCRFCGFPFKVSPSRLDAGLRRIPRDVVAFYAEQVSHEMPADVVEV